LIGFGLASFFWIPGLFEAKYTLRNIVTAGEYLTRFVDFKSLLYGLWNYGITGQFSVQIGIINLFMIISSPFVIYFFYKKKNINFLLILGLLVYTIISIFLMLKQSSFIWQKVIILQNFQFPWRFLYISVFTTSVFAAMLVSIIPKKIKLYVVFILIFIVLFTNKDYWHAKSYLNQKDAFFTGVYSSTTDTGESTPIWSVRFMEHPPKGRIEVIKGDASIRQLSRFSTKHVYQITSFGAVRIRENTLYFPGWRVLVDGKPVSIEFQDPQNRGLITFDVFGGVHNVLVEFTETKLRLYSDLISLISIIVLVMVSLLAWLKGNKII
ncbi:MAG: hypothetical protein M1365_16245, partial [Actinobacteria bacterium]|nr:hypothetical protein [Actinomycetota bacterium]